MARKSLTLSLTVNGLRGLALKHELMAKPDLTWVGLGDILRSRTVAAESSEKLVNPSNEPSRPAIKTEPREINRVYEKKDNYQNQTMHRDHSSERFSHKDSFYRNPRSIDRPNSNRYSYNDSYSRGRPSAYYIIVINYRRVLRFCFFTI